ncbi:MULTISPECIES: thioredoxin domain-containing protein [unclassified Pseudonocardia]|uniref:DsbA family protein n=1 Tax=unclassified Pseudonocardia TaxID=2619320 RepID=UPI0009658EAF|nr:MULTISPECIES: thioredoxin domain-containing protein [unclassified Pseudonocardia]MBN9097994.1 thioredoxin domain-containing protein [Pseudonocardia sp.]OJY54398.1 MAG: thioredoxin [Pseudonocardia sp. 73-21]
MTRNVKLSIGLIAAFAMVVGALLVFGGGTAAPGQAGPATSSAVRADSHRLSTAADGKVTFVEFLDFECEACGALYPAVEQLRTEYAGRVTFVARYFPLPGHFNAERAARSVEAAAQQGRFEQMYQRMYETQAEWGEQQVPMDDRFRGYAAGLGLDMAAYDRAYADPATLARINVDVADGTALGVRGTPTLFLNGQKIEPRTYADLTSALDAALAS